MSKRKKRGSFRDNLIARSEEAKTVRKIVAIIIISLLAILVIGVLSGYLYISSALEPVDPDSDEEITVEIPIGSSSSTIGEILEENGLIKDSRIFRFYATFNNTTDFQAGEYTFTPAMTMEELTASLQTGRVIADPVHTVTIPEGTTVDDIAEIYSEHLHFSKDEFLEMVNDPEYIEQLIESYPTLLSEDILSEDIRTPLEGYLFASTYSFYEQEPTIALVVEEMLNKTVSVVEDYVEELEESDLSVHEILTFASLVENEARTEEQRMNIAGVFYNRLDEGMQLQTDPTVLYALGEHRDRVLFEDLEVESPYNTYYIEALPVGPISNFAENSLQATLDPEESEYLYFLHDEEGEIHYAETFEEHGENRELYID
ncbi:endolytic transglycosylase MltG [Virgibacillus kimchii]